MTFFIVSSAGAVLSTAAGGGLLLWKGEWTKRYLWRFLAFGSGVLLGITFMHVLPEAWEMNPHWAGAAVLLAFGLFFAVEEFTVVHACTELMDDCHVHSLGYGAFLALTLHSVADGLAMGFAYVQSPALGAMVSGALILHKFSDGITLTSLLQSAGHSQRKTWGLLFALSLATPLGLLVGIQSAPWISSTLMAALLGLAAGGFLYVSAADILPRLHRTRDRTCWIFLAAGIALSLALGGH